MAYTTYPKEAQSFSSKVNNIKDKLDKTESGLKEVNTIFKIDTNEDYLTLKTIEATEELVNMVAGGKATLETESALVTNKANALEREARELAQAREKEKEKETEVEGQ